MKRLVSTSLMLFLFSCATLAPPEMLELEKVIQTDGSKDELFIKANNWAVEKFNDADAVIEFSDKEAGNIAGKYVGTIQNSILEEFRIRSNVRIDIKDNRLKIKISNPHSWAQDYATNQYKWYEIKYDTQDLKRIRSEWEKLIESLETSMNAKSNDNW